MQFGASYLNDIHVIRVYYYILNNIRVF